MKETVKERAILQEKITEGRINGKNAMTVSDINELKGHRGSAIHGIFITAGRAVISPTKKCESISPILGNTTRVSLWVRGLRRPLIMTRWQNVSA